MDGLECHSRQTVSMNSHAERLFDHQLPKYERRHRLVEQTQDRHKKPVLTSPTTSADRSKHNLNLTNHACTDVSGLCKEREKPRRSPTRSSKFDCNAEKKTFEQNCSLYETEDELPFQIDAPIPALVFF